ncbi:MAG TPA: hypothetical protein VG425_03330, partial [Casimicrobiaceae bacterium]|nr:hypothetical protein [Casimicrobiaceae bacterium]
VDGVTGRGQSASRWLATALNGALARGLLVVAWRSGRSSLKLMVSTTESGIRLLHIIEGRP